jgi:hypothetical protein
MQKRLGGEPLEYFLDWRVLGYAGHTARMGRHRLPRKIMTGYVQGKATVGAPPKSHETQINECLNRKGISIREWEDLATDKNKWRTMIKRPSILHQKKLRKPEVWEVKPVLAIGRLIEKKFKSKYYMGVVTSADLDSETNETIWKVVYDDGDTEDLNSRELAKILYDDGNGSAPAYISRANSTHSMETRRGNTRTNVDEFTRDPRAAVGKFTHEYYGGALYVGYVTEYDMDAANGQTIWRVVYPDGDAADYNIYELRDVLVE